MEDPRFIGGTPGVIKFMIVAACLNGVEDARWLKDHGLALQARKSIRPLVGPH
jgi:hypothetical protein